LTAKNASEAAQVAAETAESNAASSATSAASSATSASGSATTATTQAGNASTSASNAATSATSSAASASSASAAKDAALAALDNFDDRYLGQKASDPSVDNDGNALITGALYFDTTNDVMRVYDGSQWLAAYADVSGSALTVNNLSDLANAATARTNLGLGTAATTAASDYATAAQADQTVSLTGSGATNVSGTYPNFTITSTDTNTDTNTTYTAGSGITLTGTTFSNAAPDQTVSLTGSGATNVSGTYPNFTISSTDTNTDTNTTYTAGTNLSLSGTTFNLNTNLSGLGTISSGAITVTGAGTTAAKFINTSGNGGYVNIASNVGGVDTDGSLGLHIGWNRSNGGREINMIFDGGTTQADTEMIFTSTDGSAYTDIFQINGGGNVDIKSGGLRIGTTTVINSVAQLKSPVFGNRNQGNILLGDSSASGTNKWATVAGTHYNQTTGSGNGSGNAGVMIIGSHSTAGTNEVWIGGGPYELNPATSINFSTHSATTHALGGSIKAMINSAGDFNLTTGAYQVNGTTVIDSSRSFSASGTGSSTAPPLSITSSNASAFIHASNSYAPNMTANQFHGHFFGKAGSTKNAGGIGYYWVGSGSNSNFVSIGHWGADHMLRIYGDGNVTARKDQAASSPDWGARIVNVNATTNVAAFLGNYQGYAGLFGHSAALDAWSPIYINAHSGNGHANVYTGPLYVNGNNLAWHAGNDGSGSGLDADLLDGQQGSYYNQSQFTGSAFISRNISNPIAIDSVTTNMVGYVTGSSAAGYSDGAGFSAAYNSSWVGQLFVDFRTGKLSTRGKNNGTWQAHRFMWDNLNDGSGSGLDADLLDGQHGSYYMPASTTTIAQSNYVSGSAFSTTAAPDSVLEYQQASGQTDTKLAPSADWHNSIRLGHGDPYSYYSSTIAIRMTGTGPGDLYTQTIQNNYATGWKKYWHTNNDGSGSGLDADTVDGVQASSMVQLTGNPIITGQKYFQSNRNTTSNSPALQAYSTGGTGAIMSFHRAGVYAINMGLDSDNIFRIGGWSASANRLTMDMSGNLTMAGNVTAYSDIRLKENIKVIPDALSKVQQIRGVTFTRNDAEDLEKLHTGVIAQEVETVLPEAVSEDNIGIKNVAYGNMIGLLIESIKELKAEVDDLKTQLENK
jgi:hypothetical protein